MYNYIKLLASILILSFLNSCYNSIDLCKNLRISIDTVKPFIFQNSQYLSDTMIKIDTNDIANVYELTYTFHNINKDSSLVLNIDGINNILEYEVAYKGNLFYVTCLDERAKFHDIVSIPFFINGPKFNGSIIISPDSKYYLKEFVNFNLIHQGMYCYGKESSVLNLNNKNDNKIHFKLFFRVDSSCVIMSNDIISIYLDLYLKPVRRFYPNY